MADLQQKIIPDGRTEDLALQEQDLMGRLEDRRLQEEILQKQKSRIQWLKEGEKNEKLFHRSTIQRRILNHISILNTDQGEKLQAHTDIEQELLNYFKDMLKEPNIECQPSINKITQHIPRIITEDHNQMLLRPVTMQEVDQDMSQLKDGKASGLDGFTWNFFHFFWEKIKLEVWDLVEES